MASSAVHYRVELGAKSMKLATLVDLVRSLPGVPLAVCVGARDALDDAASAIVHATASDPSPPSVTCLHSDQTPGERARALAAFRARTRPRGDDRARDQDPRAADAASLERSRTSALVVVSDACLPVEAPLDSPPAVSAPATPAAAVEPALVGLPACPPGAQQLPGDRPDHHVDNQAEPDKPTG